MLFFINQKHIVIVDDDDFARRLIVRIRRSKINQGDTREHFLYNFIGQFMSRDLELLGRYERRIMHMEENVADGKTEGFQNEIGPIRRELLTLRGYYDELMDMGKDLEENENGFFARKQLRIFWNHRGQGGPSHGAERRTFWNMPSRCGTLIRRRQMQYRIKICSS